MPCGFNFNLPQALVAAAWQPERGMSPEEVGACYGRTAPGTK